MISDEDVANAQTNWAVLQQADAYMQLLESPGWKLLYQLQCAWLEKFRDLARHAKIDNHGEAVQALHQWQVAEDLIETQAQHINTVLSHANQVRGTRTLDDALLMEKVQHEHESGNRTDPTGH